jgi:hypothetical protein
MTLRGRPVAIADVQMNLLTHMAHDDDDKNRVVSVAFATLARPMHD